MLCGAARAVERHGRPTSGWSVTKQDGGSEEVKHVMDLSRWRGGRRSVGPTDPVGPLGQWVLRCGSMFNCGHVGEVRVGPLL
jgi:hypothetical protein